MRRKLHQKMGALGLTLNADNKWSRPCPECQNPVTYTKAHACATAHLAKIKCSKCKSHYKELILSGRIWQVGDAWASKCPHCPTVKIKPTLYKCIQSLSIKCKNCRFDMLAIQNGYIYQSLEGKWCRLCPKCKREIQQTNAYACARSHKYGKTCHSCGRKGKQGGMQTPENIAKFRQRVIKRNFELGAETRVLQEAGHIWQKENRWCKSCPNCGKPQSYTCAFICARFFKKNSKCNSCAKTGQGNPFFEKQLSASHREKLRIAGTGQIRPKTEATRRKISATKRQNRASKASAHNGNNQFKRRPFSFPNGSIVNVQGYEPNTLALLVAEGFTDIFVTGKERPVFAYNWKNDEMMYIPDCYVKSIDTVIETKSTWTWNTQRDRNIAKFTGVLKDKHNLRLIIWKNDMTLAFDKTFKTLEDLNALYQLAFSHARYGENPITAVNPPSFA